MIDIPGRIPIRIHPIFWFLVALISVLNTPILNTFDSAAIIQTLTWAVVIVVSLLIHEYGHAFTALAFGQEAQIELMGMGGLTSRSGPSLKKWQDFLIVLNGPLAGIGLCICVFLLQKALHFPKDSLLGYALNIALYINIFWTILNLLPVQPLDGGRLMGIFLEGLFGVKGLRISFFISMLIAGAMGIFFLMLQALIGGVLFFLFAFESYRGWSSLTKMSEEDRDVKLQHQMDEGTQLVQGGKLDESLKVFENIMSKTGKGLIFQTALENSAEIYMHEENYPKAYLLLSAQKNNLSQDGLSLLHRACYYTGKWKEIASIGNEVYQFVPTAETALINAIAYAHLNQPKPAIGWLQNAIDQGLANPREVLHRGDFDPIRYDPAFQDLYTKFEH